MHKRFNLLSSDDVSGNVSSTPPPGEDTQRVAASGWGETASVDPGGSSRAFNPLAPAKPSRRPRYGYGCPVPPCLHAGSNLWSSIAWPCHALHHHHPGETHFPLLRFGGARRLSSGGIRRGRSRGQPTAQTSRASVRGLRVRASGSSLKPQLVLESPESLPRHTSPRRHSFAVSTH